MAGCAGIISPRASRRKRPRRCSSRCPARSCVRSTTSSWHNVADEDLRQPNGLRSLRVRGGLPEHLRFFHLTDPAISRKRTIEGVAIKGAVPPHVASIESLGLELPLWDITTGTGVRIQHGSGWRVSRLPRRKIAVFGRKVRRDCTFLPKTAIFSTRATTRRPVKVVCPLARATRPMQTQCRSGYLDANVSATNAEQVRTGAFIANGVVSHNRFARNTHSYLDPGYRALILQDPAAAAG